MFDKEAQRKRAQELEWVRLQAGQKAAPPTTVPVRAVASTPAVAYPFSITSVPFKDSKVISVKKVKLTPKKAEPKITYSKEPFTNDIGQTIYHLNKIVAITSGYSHSINVASGVYLGKRLNSRGEVSAVVVRVKRKVKGFFLPGTDTKVSSGHPDSEYGSRWVERQTSLPSKRVYAIK